MNRFSLFTKIFLWFLISFAIIGGIVLAAFIFNTGVAPDSHLRGKSAARLRATAHLITQELQKVMPLHNRDEINTVLSRWSEAYDVDFLLFRGPDEMIAGAQIELPRKVGHLLHERRRFTVQTKSPRRVWVALPLRMERPGQHPGQHPGKRRPGHLTLLIVSDPAKGQGLISDSIPWLLLLPAILLLAVIFWLPLVRHLTRPIKEMTGAAESIARGNFDVRVDATRSDEIGRLGKSINDMAAKLSNLVEGQRRFLGDVSHELRSPLTRLQVVLDLLEQTANPQQGAYIKDGQEEIEQMSALVGELLAFARAEVNRESVTLEPTPIASILERVAKREGKGDTTIRVEADSDAIALADPNLLSRAVSNLVRNAVRYAGQAGPIDIRASSAAGKVQIEVVDCGQGVDEKSLERLFEPFFRPETDRDRNTGGAGLGLAIAKTCVDACNGEIHAQNLQPNGFSVMIVLNAPDLKNETPSAKE
jgi:two-component system sensor histidine kinase CpxA